MRHLKRTAKLGRSPEHRNAMLANMVCCLIKDKRITTTLAKAKAVRSVAEKILTLGKQGTLHARRLAAARLRQQSRRFFPGKPTLKGKVVREKWCQEEDVLRILFEDLAPVMKERAGGYTRIIQLGQRQGDAAQLAILEWVDAVAPEAAPVATEAKEAAAAK